MYSQKPIPSPFRRIPEQPQSISKIPPVTPIEATEKAIEPPVSRQGSISPLAALFFLDLFSTQKKDG